MKKIAILAALAMAATTSLGAINVAWGNYGFLSGADASKYATEDGVKLVWDLVYTSGSAVTTPELNTATGEIKYASTDEVLSRRVWETGSTDVTVTDLVASSTSSSSPLTMDTDYAYISAGVAAYKNADYVQSGGGIYAAVFQYLSDGSVYADFTAVNTGINWDNKMGAADKVHFGNNQTEDSRIATYMGQVTEVPEPATMGLLGLGALAMVIRRKLRK